MCKKSRDHAVNRVTHYRFPFVHSLTPSLTALAINFCIRSDHLMKTASDTIITLHPSLHLCAPFLPPYYSFQSSALLFILRTHDIYCRNISTVISQGQHSYRGSLFISVTLDRVANNKSIQWALHHHYNIISIVNSSSVPTVELQCINLWTATLRCDDNSFIWWQFLTA